MTEVLHSFVESVKANIPGFIAVSVTEIESGVAYESYSAVPSYDANLASAYNLEVVKSKIKAVRALGLEDQIEDITIKLTNQIHLLDIAPSGNYFIYLAVDSDKANLGITRTLLNKHKKDLNSVL